MTTMYEPKGASASVEVKVIVNAPVITRASKTQVVFAGDSMSLICKTEGLPKPEVSWTMNGTDSGVAGPQFTIEVATAATDVGSYMCKARNHYGETNRTIWVSVVQPPILEPVYEAEVGQSLTIPCVDPTPYNDMVAIQWYKNGQKVPPGTHGQLDFQRVKLHDAGDYRCEMRSSSYDHPEREVRTRVVVKTRTVVGSSTGVIHTVEGQTLNLQCNALKGQRSAKRLWRFNGVSYSNMNHVKEKGMVLLIPSVSAGDSGNYSCQATSSPNPNQQSAESIHFVVKVEPRDEPSKSSDPIQGCEMIKVSKYKKDNASAVLKWRSQPEKCKPKSLQLVWWPDESPDKPFVKELVTGQTSTVIGGLSSNVRYFAQVNTIKDAPGIGKPGLATKTIFFCYSKKYQRQNSPI